MFWTSYWGQGVIVVYGQLSNLSAISRREQVNLPWDEDEFLTRWVEIGFIMKTFFFVKLYRIYICLKWYKGAYLF